MTDMIQNIVDFTKLNPVMGGVLGAWLVTMCSLLLRYLPQVIKGIVLKQFTVSVTILNNTILFDNLIDWYERNGVSRKTRTLNAIGSTDEKPSMSIGYGVHYFWHNFRLFKLIREKVESNAPGFKEFIQVSTLGRSQEPIRRMLNASVPTLREDILRVYHFNSGWWRRIQDKSSRRFDTIFIPKYKKDLLIKRVRDFMESREFYAGVGTPHRLGIIFHGVPGAGKTSTVKALCHHLKYDLYVLELAGLDNAGLVNAFSTMPERCIVLIEDIDTYDHCSARTPSEASAPQASGNDLVKAVQELNGITLSGILNAVDGVMSTDHRILVMTTNHLDKLDSALTRKGRIDFDLEFGNMDQESFIDMMAKAYPGFSVPAGFKLGQHRTPADVQGIILENKHDPETTIKILGGDT
jgi:mitochondrial chaperone BCS1